MEGCCPAMRRVASLPCGGLLPYHVEGFDKDDPANPVHCSECGKDQDGKKKLWLWSMPRVLTLQLKLFDAAGRKICRAMTYPTTLHLDDFMDGHAEQTPLYELHALIKHTGNNISEGHYEAYFRSPTQKWEYSPDWVHANDEVVVVCTEEVAAKQSEVYILQYHHNGYADIVDDQTPEQADKDRMLDEEKVNAGDLVLWDVYRITSEDLDTVKVPGAR